MTKKKKSRESLLPSRPPKRTGKRMPHPIDPKEDFNEPTCKDAAAGAGTEARQEEQAELLEVPKPAPVLVANNRFLVSFLKPIFGKRPKNGEKIISLQMAVALSPEHEKDGLLPKQVIECWKFIRRNERTKLNFGVPPQTVRLYLAPDIKEEELVLPITNFTNVSLAVVQKKGEGEAIKVIRFQFRIMIPFSREAGKWAEGAYGASYWMTTATSQESLFEEEDEE